MCTPRYSQRSNFIINIGGELRNFARPKTPLDKGGVVQKKSCGVDMRNAKNRFPCLVTVIQARGNSRDLRKALNNACR